MPIELFWDNDEQTVFLAEFEGHWTWDELHRMLRTVQRLSQERQMTLGAIIDVSRGFQLPNGSVFNPEGLANFRRILQFDPDNKGPVAIYGMNGMLGRIFDTASKLDGRIQKDVYFARTLDDARQYLYHRMADRQQMA